MATTVATLLLTACSHQVLIDDSATESEIYFRAQEQMKDGMYGQAAETYRELETRYPFGQYAEQAQLELVYAYYQNDDFDAAMATAERFIRLYPQHPNVDYAWYLRGLAAFSASTGFVQRYLPVSIYSRDMGRAKEAYSYLGLFVSRYPESPYAADARQRLIFIRNQIAEGELDIARYYQKRRMRVAAANRAAWVLRNMPDSPAATDALAIMAENYFGLGLNHLADDTVSVLRLNAPEHPSFGKDGQFKYTNKDAFATPES
jgi:outer membrane protein assembly factor BamD